VQGRNEWGKGGAIPWVTSHYGDAKWLRDARKSPNNVTSTFFNSVHLLPKDLSFEHGGATCLNERNLLLAPGTI